MQLEETLTRPKPIRQKPPDPIGLQRLYLDDVARYVATLVEDRDEADDVTMEVFHAAFASIRKLRHADLAKAWLLGIARRKCADSLRRVQRNRTAPLTAEHPAPEHRTDQTAVIRSVLGAMPADQSEALVLKYVCGLSTDEVGLALGRSTKAANSLLQRARERFYRDAGPMFLDAAEVNS